MALCEYVKHHLKEEPTEMFSKAKASKLDLMALGAELVTRKEALLAGKRRTMREFVQRLSRVLPCAV